MTRLAEARARHALAKAGLDPHVELEPLSSVTNEVWRAGDHIVRVNRHPVQRLWREATLTSLLPLELRVPRVVDYGGMIGSDWMVTERAPGQTLSRCWPTMTEGERRTAVSQLATQLQILHQFVCSEPLPEIDTPQLLTSTDGADGISRVLDALSRAQELEFVDPVMILSAKTLVREIAPALLPFDTRTFIHGDLHFENVLWDGSQLTALLDFEWSRAAPADLELDVLLRFCAYPFLHVPDDYEHLTRTVDYEQVPWWLAEDYPALFDGENALERVRLYSIAYDVRDLLLDPPRVPVKHLSRLHAYHRLEDSVRGESYLDGLAEGRMHESQATVSSSMP